MKSFFTLPNLLTLSNFFCGIHAIYFSIEGKFAYAVYLILVAMVFDFFDGKIARSKKLVSELGSQLDSLADMVSFGIAPIVIFSTLIFQEQGKGGWSPGVVYAICGTLRLARYNVQAKGTSSKPFAGLPIPAAAGVVVSIMLTYLHLRQPFLLTFSPLFLVFVGVLMVTNIPYANMNRLPLKKETIIGIVAGSLLIGAIFKISYLVFLIGFVGYTARGLVVEIKRRAQLSAGN